MIYLFFVYCKTVTAMHASSLLTQQPDPTPTGDFLIFSDGVGEYLIKAQTYENSYLFPVDGIGHFDACSNTSRRRGDRGF